MRRVPRHEIDLEFAGRQVTDLGEDLAEQIDDLEGYSEGLSDLLSTALMQMRYRCALDPTAKLGPTWESVVLAMQAGAGIFAVASGAGASAEFRIYTRSMRFPVTGPRYWTDAGTWLRALWLVMICRERERTDLLCEVSVDLLRASGARFDEYIYPWVEALRTFWRQEPGYYDKINAALRGTDPAVLRVASEELVLLTLYPPIKMFDYLIQQDADKFNNALFEALDLHRIFWTKTPERSKDPDGYIALGPTALACLAREMGIAIDVESEYMPQVLVEGGWCGEFRT